MGKNIIEKYKSLSKRERIAVTAFAAILGVILYYGAVYKPLTGNLLIYKTQTERLTKQFEQIKAQHPEIQAGRERIEEEQNRGAELFEEIEAMEKKLPSKNATARLIAELTRLAKDIKIDSIRQKIDKGEEYSRIFVEIRFDAPFSEIVDYIRQVETISPFLKVEELEISEPQKRKKESDSLIKLVVSSLLGDVPFSEQLKAKETKDGFYELRDIFVSKVRPESTKAKIDIKLEGITYNAGIPTAIVGGEVVKEGSVIGEYTLKKIEQDKIILTDGVEEYLIAVER
ncbi:MAG: type 4a pilus biogenesis protein PilO [Candidatus Omnitrophota bacterium]